jgi:hypothetical protein
MEWYYRAKMGRKIDAPKEIIEKAVEARRKLIAGFKGNPKADAKKVSETYFLFPSHFCGDKRPGAGHAVENEKDGCAADPALCQRDCLG